MIPLRNKEEAFEDCEIEKFWESKLSLTKQQPQLPCYVVSHQHLSFLCGFLSPSRPFSDALHTSWGPTALFVPGWVLRESQGKHKVCLEEAGHLNSFGDRERGWRNTYKVKKYSQLILLFCSDYICQVTMNTELMNPEPLLSVEIQPLVTVFSSTNQYVTLFYMYFCLKTPYLICRWFISINSQPTAPWLMPGSSLF